MDEKKKSFPSHVADQEMDIGDCSTEGEDEGEGDDEEEDGEELDDSESVGDEESEDEIVDDEDDVADDAVPMITTNFNVGHSPHPSLPTPTYEISSPSYRDSKYPLGDDINNKKQVEPIIKPNESMVVSRVDSAVPVASTSEKKIAVKLKKYKDGVYSFSDRPAGDGFSPLDADADDRLKLFKEKWPGKVCAFCNLGERSQLGQGEFMRDQNFQNIEKPAESITSEVKELTLNKHKKVDKISVSLFEPVDELSAVGHSEKLNITELIDEEGCIFFHLFCALYSVEITRAVDGLVNVSSGISKSLSRLCYHCNRYGASVPCSFNNCDKIYHYPCSAASEGFQYSKTNSYVCRAHVDHIPLLSAFNDVTCRSCHSLGNVMKLMMCSVCGSHYHTSCVGLASLPETRTGWQCHDCRACQVCRGSNNSSKVMHCGTCDKAYHAACLRPVLTSIPKFVWKCKGCRMCSDCGSRTPGSGASSRWHHHFTVCDSCYQQRNKGYSCPVCHKAYRTGATKDMFKCNSCGKCVHQHCDPTADLLTYQKKGDSLSDNPYYCQLCKNTKRTSLKRKEGFDDSPYEISLNTSQESSMSEDFESETADKDDKFSSGYGLGKGKPLTARKKMALQSAKGFRSKYAGKSASPGSFYQKKNQKITDFGRKRCTKSKIRGVFGAPGLGLQRPLADSQNKSDSDNGENKIILCSANDKFVLSQDVCAMCGALGTDQEGCLIACVQCGQCYHPYCVNIKVTKVILQKGWRCLDCTVCEGCGQRDDESRLTLCDDCDISYHIYCMEPKLDSVPRGTWKCKWCALCLTCGSNEPGVNCSWSKNYTECGPCSSRLSCPKCLLSYTDGDLIIKCDNCERWLHGDCDQLRTEQDAEKCAAEGYVCLLCRPENTPPPHLAITPSTPPACSTPKQKIRLSPIQVPECEFNFSEPPSKGEFEHFVDGVYLSDSGFSHLNSLINGMDAITFTPRKKKRCNLNDPGGSDQGIMDSIESVVAAGESPTSSSSRIIYKEGMVIEPGEDGKAPHPPEGFNIFKNDSGVMVLRRKRIRKIGVGGFNARMRTLKSKEKMDDDGMDRDMGNEEASSSDSLLSMDEKPRKKKNYRKPKSKFAESYPSYIQDAFFGRELLDTSKDNSRDIESSDSDSAGASSLWKMSSSETVVLSQDELKILEEVKAKQEELEEEAKKKEEATKVEPVIKVENEEKDNNTVETTSATSSGAFKDILTIPDNLLHSIINEDESNSKTNPSVVDDSKIQSESDLNHSVSTGQKTDELSDILGPNFAGLPNMDNTDVEDLFKGVLTDETQDSPETVPQEVVRNSGPANSFSLSHPNLNSSPAAASNQQSGVIISQSPQPIVSPSHSVIQGNMNITPGRGVLSTPCQVLPPQQNIPSPATYPAASPYHSEYSTSPSQFSPAFSEPPSPWIQDDNTAADNVVAPQSSNQKLAKKMEDDESLGENATISSVLYANLNHPELKTDYPVWNDRFKQISKKWKALSQDQKNPILALARENRTKLSRGRKAHQITKDESSSNEANGSSNVFEPESSNGSLNKPVISDISNSDSMSKVCQEDLFHPLLRALSNDSISNVQLNSNDQSFPVTSSPNHSTSPENQNVMSTGSNTSPPFTSQECTVDSTISRDLTSPASILNTSNHSEENETIVPHQTVTTTIPSHPSTIQYIPIIQTPITQSESTPLNVRTVHLISTAVPSQSDAQSSSDSSTRTSTIHYQYVPTMHQNRNTIHYPPSNIQIIHSGSSLIMSSNSLIAATLQSVASSSNESASNTASNNNFLQIIPSQSSQNPALVRNIQVMSLASEDHSDSSASDSIPSDSISDQNIRVLTPSEIMKTLPSLGQESFDVSTEQEKTVSNTQKTRESEEEKQWKRAQALRQQQVSTQQQQLHDSRIQNLQRLQQPQSQPSPIRQIPGSVTDNSSILFSPGSAPDSKPQLHISASQESETSPSITPPSRPPSQRSFSSPVVRMPSNSNPAYHRIPTADPFAPAGTPRPQFIVASAAQNTQTNIRPSENEGYAVVQSGAPDMTRQLRDLLQRQQNEPASGEPTGTSRIWVQDTSNSQPNDSNTNQSFIDKEQLPVQATSNSQTAVFKTLQTVTSMAPTFRSPLPPTQLRQRLPMSINQQMIIRPRIISQQMIDNTRLRIFLQQQQLIHQQRQIQLQQQLPQQHQQNLLSRSLFRQPLQFQQQPIQIHQQQPQQPQQSPSQQQQHQVQQQQLLHQEQHRQQQQQQIQQHQMQQQQLQHQLQHQLQQQQLQQQHQLQQQQQQQQPQQQHQQPQMHLQQHQQQHIQQQHHIQQQQQSQQQTSSPNQSLPSQQKSPQSINMSTANLNQMLSPAQSPSQSKSSPLHSAAEPSYSEQAQNILSGNAVKEEFPNFKPRLERDNSSHSDRSQILSTEKQINSQQSLAEKMDTQNEGIPESVAADLDALDRDGVVQGNIGDMQFFSEFIEDELLAEMGSNFNILEYADPELDEFTSNEKTNFLNDFVNSTSDPTKIKEEEDLDSKNDIKLNEKESNENSSASMNFSRSSVESEMNENSVVKVENKAREENIQRDLQAPVSIKTEYIHNENCRDLNQPMMAHLQQRVVHLQRIKDEASGHLIAVSSSAPLSHHCSTSVSQSSLILPSTTVVSRPSSATSTMPLTPVTSTLPPSTPIQSDIPVQSPVPNELQNQLPVITPPPPPPYPGPPPPYPSQLKPPLVSQQMHPHGNSSSPNVIAVSSATGVSKLVHHSQITGEMTQLHRRPLLLQEQPLLLEDLVEQEKREQVKQSMLPNNNLNAALPPLSDLEFERLKADVLSESSQNLMPTQGQNLSSTLVSSNNAIQSNTKLPTPGNTFDLPQQQSWQQPGSSIMPSNNVSSVQATNVSRSESSQRITLFNMQTLPAPPEPSDTIVTEQDHMEKQRYERWLEQQNSILDQQKKHYESEINKLRKTRKSINSKLRGLRKQGNDLPERDAQELQRINADMPSIQKLVESSRKSCKQHANLILEYKNKHPSFNYLPDNVNNATVSSNAPSNVVTSSIMSTSTISNTLASQQQQKIITSIVGAINRPSVTTVVGQNQVDEMLNAAVSSKTHQTTLQPPIVITSQIRPGTTRQPEQVYRCYLELNTPNSDQNTGAQRQRRILTQPRQVVFQQTNSGLRLQQQFAQPASPAPPLSPMVQTLHSLHSPSHYSQPPSSPMGGPPQNRRHVAQFIHPSSSPVPSQSPQPPSSPMSLPSPRHTPQFVHPSSPAPPQSPIYSSQPQYISHGGSPIPARSPVLIRRSPSVESFVQDNQQSDVLSGMNFNQDNFNGGNSNHNNGNNNTSSGGGCNALSYVNTIPMLEEFKRFGIKPGLMGGSPAWNQKPESNENETKNEVAINNSIVDEVDNLKPSTSSKTVTLASQFGTMDDDVDSRDSSSFPSFASKMGAKMKSFESLGDYEGNEFSACGTPKTSEDSIELPMYKDVTLMESCKSEENSLEIGEFQSAIDENEMSVVLEEGMHLTLDPSDVRSEDLLSGCLVSPNFVVLNVSEEHEGIMDDTSEFGQILLLNKMDDLNKGEGVIITDVTDIKSEEMEEKPETDTIIETEKAEEDGDSCVPTTESKEIIEIKSEASEIENEMSDKENEKIVDNETVKVSTVEENMKDAVDEEKLAEICTGTSTASNLPVRTTSVLQMTPSLVHTSPAKEAPVTFSNNQLPVYFEDFHSYVKKLPKTAEKVIKEESDFEKDKQLFDETLKKIQNEKREEAKEISQEKSDDNKSDLISMNVTSSTVQSSVTNAVIAVKEMSSTFVTSPSLIKKEIIPVTAASTSGVFVPRVKPNDESQNVLLKQLLQNSTTAGITHSTMTQHVTKPSLSASPAYRSPPRAVTTEASVTTVNQTPSENTATPTTATSVAKIEESKPNEESMVVSTTSSTETASVSAFTSKPSPVCSSSAVVSSSSLPRTQFLTSTPTTSTMSVAQFDCTSTVPRKDVPAVSSSSVPTPVPASIMSPMHIDIKKEPSIGDELTSPQPRVADAGDTPNSVSGESSSSLPLDAQDLKKLKRRQYQAAKRRQSQSKEHSSALPKKRPRKTSKTDEDYSYDSFVDTLMTQLRQLPPLSITEPLLTHNYAVCLPYGSGDPTKINIKTWVNGDLNGEYGSLTIPGQSDHYNTVPFGDAEPVTPTVIPPTTRGFYNEEFSPLNLEAEYEERRLEMARMERETESPDSIMSSSSPECIIPHTPVRFAGLRLIDENGSGVDSEEDEKLLRRISPVIPLVVPLALRPRVNYQAETDKENCGKYVPSSAKSRHSPTIPLRDSGNLSVTLTLSSKAAQDIVGVLKNLATVLNIPPPASYKITDRIPSPNKINPFGNKFHEDVEEAELQQYFAINKCCHHCKTPISDLTSIRKKASEMPFVVQDGLSEDLLFCSTSCYLQMLLLVPTVISEHKVSSSDEASLDPSPCKKPRLENGNDSQESQENDLNDKSTDASVVSECGDVPKSNADIASKGETTPGSEKKIKKGVKYRTWSSNNIPPPVHKFKRPTEKEMTETLFRMGITVTPSKMPEDMRTCAFCHQIGDGVADGPSRLLNYDVDKWVHLNCSLWSNGVYETVNGALMDCSTALQQGLNTTCSYCHKNGASLKCYKNRCSSIYHLSCAMKDECIFLKDKRFFCNIHVPKGDEDSQLTTLAVYRRVYVDRDENRQIASIVQNAELTHLMRIGSLIFLNVGQLLPHQLQEFHTANYIYPVGYKAIRFYWSMRVFNKRCLYICSIHDAAGRPEFRILVQEPGQDDLELIGSSPKEVWTRILEPLTNLRRAQNSVQIYPRYVTGEDLFGLTEPAIVRILENLPGIETLPDYRFKYGKNPLLELPLAVNPSGCARLEPRARGNTYKRAFTQRTSSIMPRPVFTSSPLFSGDISCPYSKHFVHSKSSQYKKMKQEWRNYVYLARSKIQGLGLYAARDIDKHTMVIEYIGEIIRSQLSDFREKQYESKNRGVYMFRLDENRVVDATICGGLARYINHSCNPNCVTEKVEVDREYRIIIFSKRRIARGEELSYDYQFDIEDDSQKIPCLCGASNCRKWMN